MERDLKTFSVIVDSRISTHTLTWSVTATLCLDFDVSQNFNSHAHVERDRVTDIDGVPIMISTHTLTWSVTRS